MKDEGECDQSYETVSDESGTFVEDGGDRVPYEVTLGDGVDLGCLVVVSVKSVYGERVGVDAESVGLTSFPPNASCQGGDNGSVDEGDDVDIPADACLAVELGECFGE